ncbi:hypothetical protein vBRpoSV10_135 [Ruegeria phage vB_RpoS-V10]|nr:hypothetical protein vBRpoSV10_135 [Ruegeria phage vB_RpoS-V10]
MQIIYPDMTWSTEGDQQVFSHKGIYARVYRITATTNKDYGAWRAILCDRGLADPNTMCWHFPTEAWAKEVTEAAARDMVDEKVVLALKTMRNFTDMM